MVTERYQGKISLPITTIRVCYPIQYILFTFKLATSGIKGTEKLHLKIQKDSLKLDGVIRLYHK